MGCSVLEPTQSSWVAGKKNQKFLEKFFVQTLYLYELVQGMDKSGTGLGAVPVTVTERIEMELIGLGVNIIVEQKPEKNGTGLV